MKYTVRYYYQSEEVVMDIRCLKGEVIFIGMGVLLIEKIVIGEIV